jgi:hypothetical protein
VSAPIFISYSSIDRKIAETICQALESRGYDCWISCRNVSPGENFQESIVKALRSARLMVLVFTSNANNSDEIKKEVVLAGRHHVTVIPVRVEDVAPNDALSYEFATRQWIDLFKDWELEIGRLTEQISSILGATPSNDPTSPKSIPPGDVAKQSPRRPLVSLLTLAAIALGIVGVYLYTYTRPFVSPPTASPPSTSPPPAAQPSTDERAWLDAASVGTIQAFRQYLDRFPNGLHAAEARQRISAADEKAWADASAAGTMEAFKQYLGQFPDGAHATQARSSIVELERKAAEAKAALGVRRFDGSWLTTLSCQGAAGALGFSYQFIAQVKDGHFHGQYGTEGKPGSLTLDGKIEADGTADLYGNGIVNSSTFAAGNAPKGTKFGYHVTGRFEDARGTGSRVEGRPCNYTFAKQ